MSAEPEEAPKEPELNGVLVQRLPSDTATISTTIQLIGDVRLSEVQGLLEAAIKSFREQVGFPK